MKPRVHYKKPKKPKVIALTTIRIVLTFALLAIFGMVGYYVAVDGWESVIAWFSGKYFCMIAVILIFAATAAFWLLKLVNTIKGLNENE